MRLGLFFEAGSGPIGLHIVRAFVRDPDCKQADAQIETVQQHIEEDGEAANDGQAAQIGSCGAR